MTTTCGTFLSTIGYLLSHSVYLTLSTHTYSVHSHSTYSHFYYSTEPHYLYYSGTTSFYFYSFSHLILVPFTVTVTYTATSDMNTLNFNTNDSSNSLVNSSTIIILLNINGSVLVTFINNNILYSASSVL